MENYKEMYLHLFDTVTNVIEQLQKAQKETETIYTAEEKK